MRRRMVTMKMRMLRAWGGMRLAGLALKGRGSIASGEEPGKMLEFDDAIARERYP